MRNIAALAGIAYVSHGRRARMPSETALSSPHAESRPESRHTWTADDALLVSPDVVAQSKQSKQRRFHSGCGGKLNQLRVLAMLLLSSDPVALFSCSGQSATSHLADRCRLTVAGRKSFRAGHRLSAQRCASPIARESRLSISERTAESWEGLCEFGKALVPPKLEEDIMPEAIALRNALIVQSEHELFEQVTNIPTMSNLTAAYAVASFKRTFQKPAVKDRLPDAFNLFNGVIAVIFLRALLPRLLALETMQDFYDFAPELGLPTREEMLGFVGIAEDLDLSTKVAFFLSIFIVEKVTLIGEVIPIGVVLPALSPLLFGGVLQGTVVSAACAAISSSTNFILAQSLLREKALKLEIFGQPPVAEAAWFRALSRNIEKNGFKAALFLRLAPVLPIPLDAHWYVAGLTSLKLWEFVSAYFLAALKTCFLDAYLGSMLTSAATGSDQVAASSQGIVAVETIGIIAISVLVSQYATQVFSDMLTEEGFNATQAAESAHMAAGSSDLAAHMIAGSSDLGANTSLTAKSEALTASSSLH